MNNISKSLLKIFSIIFVISTILAIVCLFVFSERNSTEIKNYISSTISNKPNNYVYNKNDYLSNDTIKTVEDINQSHENIDLQIRPQFYVYSTDTLKPSNYDEKIEEYKKSGLFTNVSTNNSEYSDKKYTERIIEKWNLNNSQLFTLIIFDDKKKELFINAPLYVTKHVLSEDELHKIEEEAKSTIEKDGVNKAITDTVKKLNEKYSNVKVEKTDKQDNSSYKGLIAMLCVLLIISSCAVFFRQK